MSSKRMSKTVIEGGRYTFNKYERAQSSREERIETRNIINAADNDEEFLSDVVIPKRRVIKPNFNDKTNVIRRWLDKQCGRPWSKVWSELSKMYDTRTTAGRHILHDHLLRDIKAPGIANQTMYGGDTYAKYHVDAQGILRAKEKVDKRHRAPPRVDRQKMAAKLKEIRAWLGDRKIGNYGQTFVWLEPNRMDWVPCTPPSYWQPKNDLNCTSPDRKHEMIVRRVWDNINGRSEQVPKKIQAHWAPVDGFTRQGKALTKPETERWNALREILLTKDRENWRGLGPALRLDIFEVDLAEEEWPGSNDKKQFGSYRRKH